MLFDLKRAKVRFKDGGSASLELKIGDGNVTFDESKPREYKKNRGVLYAVRDGDEEPMDVSLDILWELLKGSTTTQITPHDALKRRGGAAAWVSSDSDLCNPYALDIEIWFDPNCTTEKIEQIVLPDFRYEKINHDTKGSMLKVTGKCNATEASITRVAQT